MDKSSTFVVSIIVAIVATSALYLLARRAIRRFRFSKRDMKAAGLNRKQGRQLLSDIRKRRRKKKVRY